MTLLKTTAFMVKAALEAAEHAAAGDDDRLNALYALHDDLAALAQDHAETIGLTGDDQNRLIVAAGGGTNKPPRPPGGGGG